DESLRLPCDACETDVAKEREVLDLSAANLVPVRCILRDESGAFERLMTDHSPFPEVALTDSQGVEHRLFKLPGPQNCEDISRYLSGREMFLCEGQAQYDAARTFHYERDLAGAGGERAHRFVMTYFVNQSCDSPTPLPNHFVISGLDDFDFSGLMKSLDHWFDLTQVRSLRDVDGILEDIGAASTKGPAFALVGGGAVGRRTGYVVRLRAGVADELLSDLPKDSLHRRFPTSIIQRLVLREAMVLSVDDCKYFDYYSDSNLAMQAGRAKDAQLLVLQRPTDLKLLQTFDDAEERLPPKSLELFPQVLSGVMIHSLQRM
ncbi:MAG: DUF1015 family protein, partial [Myxococcales bacterium]|nr:DUF1015 family protein [Myxococcales bacterium]